MIYQSLIDFNKLIRQLKEHPIIVNDLVNYSEEDREKIDNLIMTRYSSDMVSVLPSCQCGQIKGEYAIGTKCDACDTVVTSVAESDMESLIWCRAPEGVLKLINPVIWTMLKNRFQRSGYNIIQWLCDTSYAPSVRQPKIISQIMDTGVQRGYNNFIKNFDLIIEKLFSMKVFALKKGKVDYLYQLLKLHPNCVFSDYLPLPNRTILIVEKTNVGRYVDQNAITAINAIKMLTSVDAPGSGFSARVKENRTVKAVATLASFYEGYIKSNLASHNGQFRRHVVGTRIDFSFRAVITSLTDPHAYDEIHAPWGVGIAAFRPMLINKLTKRGFDLNSAIGFLMGHVCRFNNIIAEMLQELIDEAPNKRIPCLFLRN